MIFLCLLASFQEACYKSNQTINVYNVFRSMSFNTSNISRGKQTPFSSKGFQDQLLKMKKTKELVK